MKKETGNLSAQGMRKENAWNKPKHPAGKFGIGLCCLLLLAQTGCLPGGHGGPPGFPHPPGLPRAEKPNASGMYAMALVDESTWPAQNEKSAKAATTERTSHE